MEALIYVIGSFVFATLMYCVPILATLSVVLDWHDSIKFICIVCAFIQLMTLWYTLGSKGEGGPLK